MVTGGCHSVTSLVPTEQEASYVRCMARHGCKADKEHTTPPGPEHGRVRLSPEKETRL